MAATTVYTVGHSTHPIDEFIALLQAHDVTRIIDVRTIAKSRHNPQFNEAELAASLSSAGIGYQRMTNLGGLRHVHSDSINGAWRNASFRGYADYMQTPEFTAAIDELLASVHAHEGEGRADAAALMCAEAVPWRCHRSMIGDALVVRGVRVLDIMTPTTATPHTLTSFARVDGTHISYPATPETDAANAAAATHVG